MSILSLDGFNVFDICWYNINIAEDSWVFFNSVAAFLVG